MALQARSDAELQAHLAAPEDSLTDGIAGEAGGLFYGAALEITEEFPAAGEPTSEPTNVPTAPRLRGTYQPTLSPRAVAS